MTAARRRDVTLVPLTDEQREAFFVEEVANYANEQVRDAGWARDEALQRAEELTPVLERDYAEGIERGDRLWSAVDRTGHTVGWLWVKPLERAVAFLEQITVAEAVRRQGYGRAMLAELSCASGFSRRSIDRRRGERSAGTARGR